MEKKINVQTYQHPKFYLYNIRIKGLSDKAEASHLYPYNLTLAQWKEAYSVSRYRCGGHITANESHRRGQGNYTLG